MLEKAIENWLINCNENNYRVPFTQVLINEGHIIFDTHGSLEVGKDIITINNGNYFAYQLKKGDINLNEWRKMIPQIHELTNIDINHPQFERGKSYTPILITNGSISNTAINSINDYNLTLENNGRNRLKYYDKNYLLKKFVDSQSKFLLTDFEDFYLILDLLTHDGNDFFPKNKFIHLLSNVLFDKIPRRLSDKKDIVSSSLIISSYILGPFQKEKNHHAIFEAWVSLFTLLIHFSNKADIPITEIEKSLNLIMNVIVDTLKSIKNELFEKKNFMGKFLEGENKNTHNTRVLIVLGLITTLELHYYVKSGDYEFNKDILLLVEDNIENLFLWGESAIPFYFNLIKYLELNNKKSLANIVIKKIIVEILNRNKPRNNFGLPNPYYSPSPILEALLLQELQFESNGISSILREILSIDTKMPFVNVYNEMMHLEKRHNNNLNIIINDILKNSNLNEMDFSQFCGSSYFLESLILMLVRRDERTFLEEKWKEISHIFFEEFELDNDIDLFSWRTEDGDIHSFQYELPTSYKELKKKANKIEDFYFKEIDFLNFFILVFPHRTNKMLLNYLDKSINP